MDHRYLEECKVEFEEFKKAFTSKMDKQLERFFKENKDLPPGVDGIDASLGSVIMGELFVLHKRLDHLEAMSHKHAEFDN